MPGPSLVNSPAFSSPATLPLPLNPGDFDLRVTPSAMNLIPGIGQQGSLGTSPSDVALSGQDRVVLKGALGLIRAARAELASTDKVKAATGKVNLLMILSHLAGYLDGLGVVRTGTGGPSFAGMLAANGVVSLEDSLDDLEHALELALVDTRSGSGLVKAAASALGDAMISIGTGLIVASVVI